MIAILAVAQQPPGPAPRVVTPHGAGGAPSDAVVLFDGTSTARWTTRDGQASRCTVEAGAMVCTSGVGDMYSTVKHGDAQIHVEFAPPEMPGHKGQLRGNSGVYLQGRYEVQVLDSFENPTYVTGMLGALYGQAAPLVNAARKPGEWQSYDIIFRAHRCDAQGAVIQNGTLTVLLNGVLVQDHITNKDTKGGCGDGPLMFQDHSGFKNAPVTAMKFRNVWFRPLN